MSGNMKFKNINFYGDVSIENVDLICENCGERLGNHVGFSNDCQKVSEISSILPAPSAASFLTTAGQTMTQRGQQYDSPEGERSMGKAIAAYNAITGRDLKESDGWLIMVKLKEVRQWQRPDFHEDSAIDSVAYSALLAESLAGGK
jgi:hypothetical protein